MLYTFFTSGVSGTQTLFFKAFPSNCKPNVQIKRTLSQPLFHKNGWTFISTTISFFYCLTHFSNPILIIVTGSGSSNYA